MAVLSPSPLLASLRGSVGGCTFAPASGKTIVRARAAPLKHTTAKSLAQCSRANHAAALWNDLTAAQRLTYAYAAAAYPQTDSMGGTYFLTAFQLHQKLASIPHGLTLPLTPPTPTSAASFKSALMVLHPDGLACYISATFTSTATGRIIIYGQRSFSTTAVNPSNNWIFIRTWSSVSSPFSIMFQWRDILGPPITGEVQFAKVAIYSDGKLPGPPFVIRCVVTP